MIAQKSMTFPKQIETCFKLYYGEKEIMGQAEKFMNRTSIYSDIWSVEQSKLGPRYFIPERLHQQYGNMLVGGDNITESLICQLYEKHVDELLLGKAIISKAKEAVKEAKKMHGLVSVAVKEGVLQKGEGGEFCFPSGRSEDDFDLWLLKRLYNWDKYYGPTGKQQFKNKNKNSSTTGDDGDDGNGDDGNGDDGTGNDANGNDSNGDEEGVSNKESDGLDIEDEILIPNNVFEEDIELNTSSIADDASTDSDDIDPPRNYLPKGWVLFMTRGPLSLPIENRLDFFLESLSGGNKRNTKHGRDHDRKESAKQMAASRDYAFDDTSTSVSTREARGVSVVNRKFAVRAAQKDAQLTLQQYEADLLKINSVLKSKHGLHTGHLEMAKLYISLDDKEKAKNELAKATQLMEEISELENVAMKMDCKSTTTKTNDDKPDKNDDSLTRDVTKTNK